MSFGFNILKDRQIDFDTNDLSLARFLSLYEPSFRLCISCGGCTATCIANHHSGLSLRKIFILINRGITADIKHELDNCMLCGKCVIACPRGVNTRGLILKISELTKNSEI